MSFDRKQAQCLGEEGKLEFQKLLRDRVEQKDQEAEEQQPVVRRRLDDLDPEFVSEMTEKGLDAQTVHELI